MRATVLCLLAFVLVAVALAGRGDGNKGNGKGNQGDNDNNGNGGKKGNKPKQCPSCQAWKNVLKGTVASSKEARQSMKAEHRRQMQDNRNTLADAKKTARSEYRVLERAAAETRRIEHAELNETLQAAIEAAGVSFTVSLESILAKVDQANDVLQQYQDNEPLATFVAEVAELERIASEAKDAAETAAAEALAALPTCPPITVTQGYCHGCVNSDPCNVDADCQFGDKTCWSIPVDEDGRWNPSFSPLDINITHPLGRNLKCCNQQFLSDGYDFIDASGNIYPDAWGWHADLQPKDLRNISDPFCENERIANETEINEELEADLLEIAEQLAHDRHAARQKFEAAVDAEFVIANEDGAVYGANCTQQVHILQAQRDYFKEIAAADQAYYDALVEPKSKRREAVRKASREFRQARRDLIKQHRLNMRAARKSINQQRRQLREKIAAACKNVKNMNKCPGTPSSAPQPGGTSH